MALISLSYIFPYRMVKKIAIHLLANFEDDLLQKIGKLLNDRHGLSAGKADPVHGRGRVVPRLAESRRRATALLRRKASSCEKNKTQNN